jgi:L-amino acid N-acyltransferase YncA
MQGNAMTVHICPAEAGDLPAILAIYNDAVLHTTASYDYEPSTLEQRARWFEQHREQGMPVLVARDANDKVIGWGSLSKFRDKIGYQYTVEHSVYIAPDERGKGVGRLLVLALIEAARALGKHVLVGGVDASNEASLRLHQKLGFEPVAHFRQVGYKFDHWLDLIFFQKILDSEAVEESD